MWEHLVTVIKNQAEKEGKREVLDDRSFQIVDITFVKKNTGDAQIIHNYSDLKQKLLVEFHRKVKLTEEIKEIEESTTLTDAQ